LAWLVSLPDRPARHVKENLLVVELWGLGDLVIATPFLQAASERYRVTLLAKPYASELRPRFWPDIEVLPFTAPWTAFTHKYRLYSWPWGEILRLRGKLKAGRFDVGLSARWDPRDHFVLSVARARRRLGYPRIGSARFLTQPVERPDPMSHRYENWRFMAVQLGFELPPREKLVLPPATSSGKILVHTGAAQSVRVWPLDRYKTIISRLRHQQYPVQVACDPDQRKWWLETGEKSVASPATVPELLGLLSDTGIFVGNDSGPGHLAAFCGVPTFTIFGAQLPEWFSPLHPAAEWTEGKACPYKPCSDYCRFESPRCIMNSSLDEVWPALQAFVARRLSSPPVLNRTPAS
jgi:heptosyltransferase-2